VSQPAEQCALVVRNAYLLTLDARRTVYPHGALAVDAGTLLAVGNEPNVLPRFHASRVLDARGGTVHPGMIDCHIHASFHTTRGILPDTPDFVEHGRNWHAWWHAAGDEDEYAGVLLAALELARNGVTCFMDGGTILQPDAAAAAVAAVGIRASLADPFVADIPSTSAPRALGGQLWRNAHSNGLVRGHLALSGLGSASQDLVLEASRLARLHSAPLTMHQSFTVVDVTADDRRLGQHALVRYAELGGLGPWCAFSHMNVLRDHEVEAVVASGMSAIWCPLASMHWGAALGTRSPHPLLYRRGVNVALGSDSTRYGTEPQGYLAVLLARGAGDALQAEDALEMLTLGGAHALGLGARLGSLEPGKRADVVIHTPDWPEAQPGVDRVQAAVLSARSRTVDTVLVDGRVVVEHGRATLVDEDEVYRLARASATRMMDRLGLGSTGGWLTRR
jgi:5-methylthioadenosine/S-adenosylhomocysteine deaminase